MKNIFEALQHIISEYRNMHLIYHTSRRISARSKVRAADGIFKWNHQKAITGVSDIEFSKVMWFIVNSSVIRTIYHCFYQHYIIGMLDFIFIEVRFVMIFIMNIVINTITIINVLNVMISLISIIAGITRHKWWW